MFRVNIALNCLVHDVSKLGISSILNYDQRRFARKKHWDPQWRKLRGAKVFEMDLPNFDEIRRDSNKTPEEMRTDRIRRGIPPPRLSDQVSLNVMSTSAVFEPYIPPEGDGKASIISTEGTKQRFTELEKKGKSWNQVRKIRGYEEDFDTSVFVHEAQEIYLKAHNLLNDAKNNEDALHDLVTEKAFPEMVWKLEKKTFKWEFIESIEPPRVVHVRTTEMLNKENIVGQITVRFNTKQKMILYDRFGRLMYGSEEYARDILDYIVFEKQLSMEHGRWRIHAKIMPDWMPAQQDILRTLRKPIFEDTVETASASA